jgi:hypothetical protein
VLLEELEENLLQLLKPNPPKLEENLLPFLKLLSLELHILTCHHHTLFWVEVVYSSLSPRPANQAEANYLLGGGHVPGRVPPCLRNPQHTLFPISISTNSGPLYRLNFGPKMLRIPPSYHPNNGSLTRISTTLYSNITWSIV